MKIKNILDLMYRLVQLNLKIIFANKFVYFLGFAFLFYLVVVGIRLFNFDMADETNIYYILILPGILMVFYPSVFGIQNDQDSQMLEIIFGIPNYRYKVWLGRLVMILVMAGIFVFLLSLLSKITLARHDSLDMTFQLLFPVAFIAMLSFMLSTVTRNGNGAAVVLILILLLFFFFQDFLENSKFNLFLNPYDIPDNMSEIVWQDSVFKNRLYLGIGAVLSFLYGMYNLQFREKFFK